MRTLVRQSALSHTGWLNLIEARRALIEPHLKAMDLKTIGKVRAMGFHNEDSCLIEDGSPEVITSRPDLSLDTRCYFPLVDSTYQGKISSNVNFEFRPPGSSPAVGGEECFWALTPAGTWLMITATVQFPYDPRHRPTGYQVDRARVSKVVIAESCIADILSRTKITPKDMWLQLSKLAQQWHRRRQELVYDAERLVNTFTLEEQLLVYVEHR